MVGLLEVNQKQIMNGEWMGKYHNGIKLYPDTRFKNRYYEFENVVDEDLYNEFHGLDIPKGTKYVLAESPVVKKIYMVFEKPIIQTSTNWSVDMVRYQE